MKTCKQCKVQFEPARPLQMICGFECAVKQALVLQEKKERLNALSMRKDTREKLAKLKTKAEYLKDTQRFFNIFIRTRDDNHPCISCGRWHTGQYHAGHYRSVGSAPHLRFNELNCHKQCSVCNNYLSGNQLQYRKGLIDKIGIEKVEQLEADQEAKHYTIDEIKAIKVKYKNMIKTLKGLHSKG